MEEASGHGECMAIEKGLMHECMAIEIYAWVLLRI